MENLYEKVSESIWINYLYRYIASLYIWISLSNYFSWRIRLYHTYGWSLYPVPFCIGHATIQTCVQFRIHVRIVMYPVQKSTRPKLYPILIMPGFTIPSVGMMKMNCLISLVLIYQSLFLDNLSFVVRH